MAVFISLIVFALVFPYFVTSDLLGMREPIDQLLPRHECNEYCRFSLVESIPENMTYEQGAPSHLRTFDAWKMLLALAENNLNIASYYWTLRGSDIDYSGPASAEGEEIFRDLMSLKSDVVVRIAQNLPEKGEEYQDRDTKELDKHEKAEVRYLNFTQWFGAGILHTKLWIVDDKHFYVGSANMDFRSLTQVKELGVLVTNCSCLAKDIKKIFEVYWFMGKSKYVPVVWPSAWRTKYNNVTPLHTRVNQTEQAQVYLSSSPPAFCPTGRTVDINSILSIINSARKFIHVAVMDYFPAVIYQKPDRFWPVIDDALRKAAIERGVSVQLMASNWSHTDGAMIHFLQSLKDIAGAYDSRVQVKLFVVPGEGISNINYTRVNHNKYMVTEDTAYIGTSNWSGDYFISTGGIGFVVKSNNSTNDSYVNNGNFVEQLQAVFERDWNSKFAQPLSI